MDMTEQDVNWKDSAIIEEQVENLLQHLILEEKIKLRVGNRITSRML